MFRKIVIVPMLIFGTCLIIKVVYAGCITATCTDECSLYREWCFNYGGDGVKFLAEVASPFCNTNPVGGNAISPGEVSIESYDQCNPSCSGDFLLKPITEGTVAGELEFEDSMTVEQLCHEGGDEIPGG